MKRRTAISSKQSAKKGPALLPSLLSWSEIRELSMLLCDDDEKKAAALLVLVTDMRARESLGDPNSFPWFIVRQIAFSQSGNDAIDEQADLLRSRLFSKKGVETS